MPNRAAILDAAAIEFYKRGFAAASLSAIAAHIGRTKGALTREFPAKDDLAWGMIPSLYTGIDEECATALELYRSSGTRALLHFILAMDRRGYLYPQVTGSIMLYLDRAAPTYAMSGQREAWQAALRTLLREAVAQGELEQGTNTTDLAELILITILGELVADPIGHPKRTAAHHLQLVRRVLRPLVGPATDTMVTEVLRAFSHWRSMGLPPEADEQPPMDEQTETD